LCPELWATAPPPPAGTAGVATGLTWGDGLFTAMTVATSVGLPAVTGGNSFFGQLQRIRQRQGGTRDQAFRVAFVECLGIVLHQRVAQYVTAQRRAAVKLLQHLFNRVTRLGFVIAELRQSAQVFLRQRFGRRQLNAFDFAFHSGFAFDGFFHRIAFGVIAGDG